MVSMGTVVQSPVLDCNWDSNLFTFLFPLNKSAWEPNEMDMFLMQKGGRRNQ